MKGHKPPQTHPWKRTFLAREAKDPVTVALEKHAQVNKSRGTITNIKRAR